jgi:hypothetical protein
VRGGWVVEGELRHRQHARVEDRIRTAKATGLTNLPFNAFDANAAWLEIIMAATDLIAWTKLLGFTDNQDLARCEIQAFRYRVLHVAARITHSARQLRLRIDATWRWAHTIEDPTASGKPAHRHDNRQLVTPPCQHQPPNGPEPGSARPTQAARKIEVNAYFGWLMSFANDSHSPSSMFLSIESVPHKPSRRRIV